MQGRWAWCTRNGEECGSLSKFSFYCMKVLFFSLLGDRTNPNTSKARSQLPWMFDVDCNSCNEHMLSSGTYVCMGFMALITALVLCARSQDSLLSVAVCRINVVFSTAGFKDGGKPCPKTRETAALRRGVQKDTRTKPGSNPSYWCTSSQLYPLSNPSAL